MKRGYQVIILVLSVMLMCAACRSSKDVQNLAYLYSNNSIAPRMSMSNHYLGNDSITIYWEIPSKNLRFHKGQQAKLQVSYELIALIDGKATFIDSLSFLTRPTKSVNREVVQFDKQIYLPSDKRYLLKSRAYDLSTNQKFRAELIIDKLSPTVENSYLFTSLADSMIHTETYARQGMTFYVQHQEGDTTGFDVFYYRPISRLARPPFIRDVPPEKLPPADATFSIQDELQLDSLGLYLIRKKSEKVGGRSILSVPSDFPKLTRASDMVECLRFITRKKEYNQLMESSKLKRSLDNFWLQRAGSPERGKVLIREYYGRVQRANQFFTTYKEGWQTDRGLIFIIYGEPDQVVKTGEAEHWGYVGNAGQGALRFSFYRKPSPFTYNHYVLDRDPNYEDNWHQAVFEWRQGNIRNISR